MLSNYSGGFFSRETFAILIVALAQITCLAETPQERGASAAKRVIQQLDDADPAIRKAATLQLDSMGAGALEEIEAAIKDESISAESHARLKRALYFVAPRAAREKITRERLDWEKAAFHRAYDKSGNTNPKYDALAHAAIDSFLPLGNDPMHGPAEPREKALAAFRAAVQAGCNDPLILACYSIAYGQLDNVSAGPVEGGLNYYAIRCFLENYEPCIKLRIMAAHLLLDSGAVQIHAQHSVTLMSQITPASGVPPQELDAISELMVGATTASHGLNGKWDDFLKAYQTAAPNRPGPTIQRAHVIIEEAVNQRSFYEAGGGWTQKMMQEYFASLDQAGSLLEAALKIDPSSNWAARNMLYLQTLLYDRKPNSEEIDKWFDRAMSADPDDRKACDYKLRFLESRLNDPKQLLDFGHDCLQTENWRGGIPIVLINVHAALAEHSDDRAEYFRKPEVWADVQAVYEGDLLNFPGDLLRRCQYADFAALAGHWDVANQQFQKIGDKPIMSIFGSDSSYNYLRNKAARLAAESSPKGESSKQ